MGDVEKEFRAVLKEVAKLPLEQQEWFRDLFWKEVNDEINREIIRTISDKAKEGGDIS